MRTKQIRILNGSISSSPADSCCSSTTGNSEYSSSDEQSDIDQADCVIQGPTGSVRGRRHCVRKSIRSLLQDEQCRLKALQRDDENVVVYTTSMGVIRNTFENCRKLRAILFQNWIAFEERDVYLHEQFRVELEDRLREKDIQVTDVGLLLPCVFIRGRILGSLAKVEQLNEAGQLRSLLGDFLVEAGPMSLDTCPTCGGARFIPCRVCSGSRRSCVMHFHADSISLRCSACQDNKAGLIRCPSCSPMTSGRVSRASIESR